MVKKLFIALLAAAAVAAMASGCDKKDDKKADDSSSAADSTSGAAVDSTSEKKEETTTEKKEQTTTTKKETTAPPTYVYTEVFTLDFTKMEDTDEPPFNATNVDSLRIEGGALKGTATNGDPYFNYTGEFEINGDEVNWIEIVAKNLTDKDSGQFFFITPQTGWAEGASVKFWYDDCGEGTDWNKIEIEPDESAEWYGTINNFRLDPIENEGDFEIQSIKFMTRTVEK